MKSVAANWVASYRLQLHEGFGFDAALATLPYLQKLGISHLYLSPILKARAGSTHGYDVVDHALVNPELGGEPALRRLVAGARASGMGLVVDIVPNHMAVGGDDNALWLELLEWGQKCRAARFFDVDWDVPDPELNGKVLLPMLAAGYGEVLAGGDLRLEYDAALGRFHFIHFEHRFPLAAKLYAPLLRANGGVLAGWAARFRAALTPERFGALCLELASDGQQAALMAAIPALLKAFDPSEAKGSERLHRLLSHQHYRLVSWRNAADEINWRRFFDVTTLAGLKVEDALVFEAIHATLFRLYAEGLVDGFRVDHVDGLADPRAYCLALRHRLTRLRSQRPDDAPAGEAYVVLEKILAPDERLPRDWQVDGSTGYSFMNEVAALAHDPAGEAPLRALWREETGRSGDFDSELHSARRRIPQELLAADLTACAHAFHRLARANVATSDWSQAAIRRVLTEVLVALPIYRTYLDARGRSAADAEVLRAVFAEAAPRCRDSELPLLAAFDGWLGGDAAFSQNPARRRLRARAIARFQQLSSPIAAKSMEDTAFYRHGLLLSRNEVGADPRQFSLGAERFHTEAAWRAEAFPLAMLATATHDHKRGEDARMRLAALSEVPELWAAQVRAWRARHEPLKPPPSALRGPDAADELMLYQTLFGVWPLGLKIDDREACAALEERVQGWQQKAIREAKRYSGWLEPNEAYESDGREFLSMLLGGKGRDFIGEMNRLVQRLASAAAVKSLAQLLLKLTAPGLPDFYQGSELWDFSLVEPDNRRPVDYAQRAALLESKEDGLGHWHDGAVKQQLIARVLAARAAMPPLFTQGRYLPLAVVGEGDENHLAFAREWRGRRALVVVPLRPSRRWLDAPGLRLADPPAPTLALPGDWPDRSMWKAVLGGQGANAQAHRLCTGPMHWPCELFVEVQP